VLHRWSGLSLLVVVVGRVMLVLEVAQVVLELGQDYL
jgi:hypothetical protein